jgi:hypothetical protein
MGIYLNPSTDTFQESLNSAIYIDKTGLLACLNSVIGTKQRFVAVSRPRRFGKTMALEMASAYYGYGLDSGSMFNGLAIRQDASYAANLNRYDVLFITMARIASYSDDLRECLLRLEREICEELTSTYDSLHLHTNEPNSLPIILAKVWNSTGRKFVFLIDEWDCMLREQRDPKAQRIYLDWLRDLLKDQPYVALAYMTGILPIKKYGTHSTLNMFFEYSMLDPGFLAPYFGFTEEEVKPLCEKWKMSFAETQACYNGYHLNYYLPPDMEHRSVSLYSPKSIVDSFMRHHFGNYWNQTETYEALSVYIKMNIAGVKDDVVRMLAGESIPVMVDSFQNDLFSFSTKDQLYTLLIHLGYLTYNMDEHTVCIPNREVAEIFKLSTLDAGMGQVAQSIERSRQLLKSLWAGDNEAVAKAVDEAHQSVSLLDYNNEHALSYTLALAFYYAAEYYTVIRELPTGKGFADMAYIPRQAHADKPAMVIELKVDRSTNTAIKQIKERNYPAALADYLASDTNRENLLLVGINYSKKTKRHTCRIEKLENS